MNDVHLGKLLTDEQQRDAIHIAVAPLVAGVTCYPGQHVGIGEGGRAYPSATFIGVVDPFLRGPVYSGESFWMLLYPNTITSLRHEWAHPAFDPAVISKGDHIVKSQAWIAWHAEELGLSASALMRDAERWLECEDYTVQQGSEGWRNNFNPTEFWHHYEVVTGTVVDADKKGTPYCCSC